MNLQSTRDHLTAHRWILINTLAVISLMATIVICLTIGSEDVSIVDGLRGEMLAHAIIFDVRLPRILLAVLVGVALSSSGASFQALLRNPLADPFILGISGGAALGSVLAVGLHLSFLWISAAAFIGSAISSLFIYGLGRVDGIIMPARLLLTGVIFNAFCFALILFINAMVTMEQAYQILFLLIGNLEATDFGTISIVAIFVLVGFFILCALSWRMNLLSLGDDEAQSMGVDISRVRTITFIASAMMVGAAVAASGLIGFVGLFVPHAVRLIFGSDHRLLIPISGIGGAIFLVAADSAARTILMHSDFATQLPVGVITALIGAPLFFILLRRMA